MSHLYPKNIRFSAACLVSPESEKRSHWWYAGRATTGCVRCARDMFPLKRRAWWRLEGRKSIICSGRQIFRVSSESWGCPSMTSWKNFQKRFCPSIRSLKKTRKVEPKNRWRHKKRFFNNFNKNLQTSSTDAPHIHWKPSRYQIHTVDTAPITITKRHVRTQSECQFSFNIETSRESINKLEADKEFPGVVICVRKTFEAGHFQLRRKRRKNFGDNKYDCIEIVQIAEASRIRCSGNLFAVLLSICFSLIPRWLLSRFSSICAAHSPSPSILIV